MSLETLESKFQQRFITDRLIDPRYIGYDRKSEQGVILDIQGQSVLVPWNAPAYSQTLNKIGVNPKFYNKCSEDLQKRIFTEFIRRYNYKNRSPWFMRFIGENILRANLSERYLPIDHDEVIKGVMNVIEGQDFEVRDMFCGPYDGDLYLRITKNISEVEVNEDLPGIDILNSEVGHRSLQVIPMIFRLKCTNGAIVRTSRMTEYRKVHAGHFDPMDMRAFLKDKVEHSIGFLVYNWDKIISSRHALMSKEYINNLPTILHNYGMTKKEAADTIERWSTEWAAKGDMSAYSIAQAITRESQEQESIERRRIMEEIGGRYLIGNLRVN